MCAPSAHTQPQSTIHKHTTGHARCGTSACSWARQTWTAAHTHVRRCAHRSRRPHPTRLLCALLCTSAPSGDVAATHARACAAWRRELCTTQPQLAHLLLRAGCYSCRCCRCACSCRVGPRSSVLRCVGVAGWSTLLSAARSCTRKRALRSHTAAVLTPSTGPWRRCQHAGWWRGWCTRAWLVHLSVRALGGVPTEQAAQTHGGVLPAPQ